MPTSTLTDVARRAGVSVPTASRVMRGVDSVDHLLKEKVLQAASELGYQPNRLARSLRERKTYILGYMSAGSTAHFHTVLAEGVHDAGLKHGYAVVTGMSNTTERQQNYAQIFAGFQVDGLIVVPTTPHNPEINRIGAQLPIVEVDRSSSEVNRHAVLLDNRRAMQLAVDHLVDLGHTQIALLHGTLSVSTEKERYEGFRDALSQRGLEPVPELLVEDDFVEAGGKRAMNRLLDGSQPLTAVVTTTNEMLAGAVQVLRERQIDISEQLSIVGMDDTRWTRLITPPLTVIAQPAYEMGFQAVELLVAMIEGRSNQFPMEIRCIPQLIHRASTGPPASSEYVLR